MTPATGEGADAAGGGSPDAAPEPTADAAREVQYVSTFDASTGALLRIEQLGNDGSRRELTQDEYVASGAAYYGYAGATPAGVPSPVAGLAAASAPMAYDPYGLGVSAPDAAESAAPAAGESDPTTLAYSYYRGALDAAAALAAGAQLSPVALAYYHGLAASAAGRT